MTAEQMWNLYASAANIRSSYEAWSFCDGGEAGDRLAGLVLEGTKTATSSPLISYENEGIEPPEDGCYSVILFDNQEAACIIRTNKVSLVPFNQVSERHAWLEEFEIVFR